MKKEWIYINDSIRRLKRPDENQAVAPKEVEPVKEKKKKKTTKK